MTTHGRARARISAALYCCLAVLVAMLAVLPGCGCGDDSRDSAAADAGADPCAPPAISAAGAVSFADAVRFLYDGACPRQTGVDKAVFDDLRVSVIRGHVVAEDGGPLAGVRVSVPREARYGETRTGTDGGFDFVVNGGARTRLRFELDGHLIAQRSADAKTNRFLVLDEVALVQKSATATVLSFGDTGSWQAAIGDVSKDESAERRVRLLVPPHTKAFAVKPDGTREALPSGTLRITEFTRGAHGPAAMPSELPPVSGYTYASSFLFDEAGADAHIEFDSRVIAYLDNFLGMKAGASVPSGALDEGADGWRAETSGRVVKLVTGPTPSLDANGDDVPDSPAELAALGVTPEELAAISGQATSGSYFRVTMTHFSGYDFNWAFGPPADSEFPPTAPGSTLPDLPCITDNGSYFECERLTLGEDIPLVGTGVGLHYNSDRVTGYRGNTTFTVPVTDAVVPPSAKRAEVEVTVLGVTETKTYAIAPNLKHTFTWNGLDAYGRAWPGETVAEVRVALIYDGVYVDTKSFGSYGNGEAITGNGARKEVLLNRRYELRLGAFNGTGLGLGGWSLSAHHVYDPASRTLYRGDGGRRNADGIGANVRLFAGMPGGAGVDAAPVPVLDAHFGQINGLVIDDAGALYVAQTSGAEAIRKIDKGTVAPFAGAGPSGHSGDGGPATLAQLDDPSGLVALRDGRICFSEFYKDSIRCVGTDGIVRPLAGGGDKDLGPLPVPALEAKVTRPGELAEGPDGSIFVTLSAVNMVARIDRAGTIEIAVGGGLDPGENVPALKVDLQGPRGLAVAPDGSVYIAESGRNRIRRVDPSGRVTTFAGSGDAGNTGDGGFATSATFKRPTALALDGTGALYVSDQGNSRIRRVDGGKVQAFAGGGDRRSGPGAAARLASVAATAMVVARDGTLYAANDDDHTLLVFSAAFPGAATTDIVMPNEDGSELYVFDGRGRHLRTLDGLTADVRTTFTYDAAGHLTRIEDRHGNALSITRDDATGRATRISSPFGQATDLAYDADGWLATVTDPIGRKESFAYAPGGLLTQRIDAGGGVHAMAYDPLGRLTRDATAENTSFDLVSDGTATTVTSGLGRREVHTFSGGLDRDDVRSYQAPDGTITPWILRRDGTANVTFPNGTAIDITREADPRLGMLVPYAAKHVVSFPSGLSRSVTQTWSVQLDPSGALTEMKGERSSPDGRSMTDYDGTMRVLTSTSPEGRVTKETLDGEGRLVRGEYPGRMPITLTYDDRGRVATVDEGGRTTRSSYDPQSGALIKVENALGQAISIERDGALRTTAFVHADGAKSLLAWSAMDDLVGVTPPGKGQHVMAFGKDGTEIRYTPPGGTPLAFSYDLDRALASVTREDGTTSSLAYDSAGRVTSVTYPGGPLSIAYDAKTGQVRTLTTPGSSLGIDYDGLLVRAVTASGPAPGIVTFTYDAMLRRGSEQVGTSTVKYGYDHDGFITQAGSITVGRESASGLISGIDVVDAAQRFTHNAFGELATLRSQGAGGNVLDVALTYDALSRIVDKVENGAAWHYDYDVRGRLVRVRKDGADIATFSYDANGNRTDGGAVIDAQDRVTSMSGATYTYSAAGERLTKTTGAGQSVYTYDGRGYLSSVTVPGGIRADYDLDAYGRRITKRRNGTVQNRFLYRNALQPAAEVDDQGALLSRYIYARGELGPDALERAGATYLLLKDERGSIRFVIDATSGAIAQAIEYGAFGRVLSDTSPGFQPFGFAGGIYDADTGLVHFGARDYDPETGSFTRKDPSRFGGGENLYAYAGGDPINFVDPDGESVAGALVGGLEGGTIAYAEEGAVQALDPDFSGYDCDKIRSAVKFGAAVGAATGAAAKSNGRQCFAAGTEVATENGPKPIEAIAVGDRVLSSDDEGVESYRAVTRVFERNDAEEVALTFTDAHGVGAPIVTTPEHPFRAASGEWVLAGRLDVGDNVVTAEGGLATLSAALSLAKTGTVYNFEVEGTHTYFVGDAKLWVHNECNRTGGKKIPNDQLKGPPPRRGAAPIGSDGYPVELHHPSQTPGGPLDELTRTEHRGPGNFSANHSNTGQAPSQIDRSAFAKERTDYWTYYWDIGRFKDL